MFERLKRALGGSPGALADPVEPGRLDWMTRATPYRFRTWLADPTQRDAVTGVLDALVRHELTITFVEEPDGRVRLDMVSTFEGWAAATRPIWTLWRAGVRVRGLDRLDLFDDVSPAELDRLVDDWHTRAYDTAAQRRMDALAGEGTVRYAIEAYRRQPRLRGWLTAASSAAQSTSGIDAVLLETAAAEPDPDLAATLASAVAARAGIAELVSEPFDPPRNLVIAVARRRDKAAGAGYRIAESLAAPLDDELTTVLCAAARRKEFDTTAAVRALSKARPTDEVRSALEVALESADADVRDLALASMGEVFGVGARPYWIAWLESASAPQRMAAEEAIGAYGDADDVPLAAEHLGKIIRRKSSISYEPPRGNEIVGLLVRHREVAEAQAALADLTARWPKLPEELRRWLAAEQPDLVPSHAAAPAAAGESEDGDVEPPLTWPLPELKRDGTQFHLGYWDTNMFEVRDRFDELLAQHPAVTLMDGDREWQTVRIEASDPEALIAELWARAHVPSGS